MYIFHYHIQDRNKKDPSIQSPIGCQVQFEQQQEFCQGILHHVKALY